MGAERRVVFDLINVVQGVAKLPQALIRDKRLENLWLLPASQTRDKDALTDEGVGRVIGELRSRFDWILCDSPGRHRARRHARHALCGRSHHRHQPRGLLGARFRPHHRHAGFEDREGGAGRACGETRADHPIRSGARRTRRDAPIDDILEILATPLLGIIPESQDVLKRQTSAPR